jgi:hypothetical protein
MTTRTLVLIGLLAVSTSVAAQQSTKPSRDDAKLKLAMTAGPSDITTDAAVVEMDDKGMMRQLRTGTNGWTCMLLPTAKDVALDAMCGDKVWMAWADAYMARKDPMTATVGVAYMLHGDHGASNTDPYGMTPTASNEWVVSPPHVMVLAPDPKMLDALPADPHAGGPWVMWKGTKYAHIMVPLGSMSTMGKKMTMSTPMKEKP